MKNKKNLTKKEVIKKLETDFWNREKELDELNGDILLSQPWCFNQDCKESYLAGYARALETALNMLDVKFDNRAREKRHSDLVSRLLKRRENKKKS